MTYKLFSNQKIGTQTQNNTLLVKLLNFKRKCGVPNGSKAVIIQLLTLNIFFHSLLGYILMEDGQFSSFVRKFLSLVQNQTILLALISVTNYIAIITTVISLFLVKRSQHFPYLAKSCLQMVLDNIQVVARFTAFLSSFLAFIDFNTNFVALVLANFLCLIQTLVFGNYQSKDSLNYKASPQLALLLEVWSISTLTINTVIVKYLNLSLYTFWSFFTGITIFLWAFKGGFRLYHSKEFSFILKIFVALMVSLTTELLVVFRKVSQQRVAFDFVQWSFTFFSLLIFFHICFGSQNTNISTLNHYINSESVKLLYLSLSQALDKADSNTECLNLITGLINEHQQRECPNVNCWLKKLNFLDAVYQLSVSQTNYIKSKDQVCKLYLKCAYETALIQNKTPKLLIDYCEFMIAEFQDLYSYYLYLEKELACSNLSLMLRIKIVKLKSILDLKYKLRKNEEFAESYDLMEVLRSEGEFETIFQKIQFYCQNQIQFQDFLMQKQIDSKQIRDKIAANFVLMGQIDQKWAKISKFFKNQIKLYLVYILYTFFLKNQKIKIQTLRSISQSLLNEEATPQLEDFKEQKTFKTKLLFDPFSTIMVTVFKENQLLFYQTSKSFNDLTLYKQKQIINTPLNVILPFQLRDTHSQIVLQNFKEGKINFQAQKNIKKTYFVDKQLKKVKCTVFFKMLIDFESTNETFKFIAFVRKQPKLEEKNMIYQSFQQNTFKFLPSKAKSDSFSLLNNDQNIFIKDENFLTVKNNPKIMQIKHSLRLFTLISIIILVSIFIEINVDADKQIGLATTWNYILFFYRFPMALVKNYLKLSFNIGDTAQTYSNIVYGTQGLDKSLGDKQTLAFLTDKSVNIDAKYFPNKVNSINQGLSYDRIDIFYVVMGCIMTLSSSPTINRTGHEFLQLDSYLKPGFDTMINTTKLQFHYRLTEEISASQLQQKIVLAIAFLTFTLLTVNVLHKLSIFNQKNNEAFQTLFYNKKNYHQSISKYWATVKANFQKYSTKKQNQEHSQDYDNFSAKSRSFTKHSLLFQARYFEQKQEQQIQNTHSDNKQSRLSTQKQDKQARKVKMAFIFAILLGIIPVLAFQSYNLVQFSKLTQLQATGFELFRFYPTSTLVGYALITKYYSYVYPQQHTFSISRFQDTINNLKIIAETDYLANANSGSAFSDKVKNYFFGNPCTYNPAVLDTANSTLSKCVSYSNKTITTGIIPYFRYVTPQVEDYLSGRVNYTATQMDNIVTGFTLVGYYLSDAILSWTEEFNGQLTQIKYANFVLVILIGVLALGIHFVVFQWWFLSFLDQEQTLIRQIFDYLVPNQVLSAQKLIKHKFKDAGVLIIS